jgi:ferritin
VKEQGEEEKNADDLIKKFDLFGQAIPRACTCWITS